MNVKNEILDELLEMHSPLAGAPRVMPFPVPAGYFNDLAANLLLCATENADVQAINNYDVPAGYFETLPGDILKQIKTEEFVTSLPKQNPYETPTGYFDKLPDEVLAHAKQQGKKGAIVINWQPIRWAAAAILVLGLGFGSYKMLYNKPIDTNKALAAVPKDSIHAYIVQNVDDFETELILNSLGTEKTIKGTNQISEQEIVEYLNENGWDTKTEVN